MKPLNTIGYTLLFTLLSFMLFFSACEQDKCQYTYCLNGGDCVDGDCICPTGYYGEHCEEQGGGNSGAGDGRVIFWIEDDYGPVDVQLNGYTRSITRYATSAAPSCGDEGYANFTLPSGTYQYTASGSGISWDGTVTIKHGVCLQMLLRNSGGNGNGGGGGNTQMGEVTFWTNTDYQCGNITVNCNGQSRVITGYYSNGTPSCGAAQCANFTLPPGSYPFTAQCEDYNWQGNVTVDDGGCTRMHLNL